MHLFHAQKLCPGTPRFKPLTLYHVYCCVARIAGLQQSGGTAATWWRLKVSRVKLLSNYLFF